MKKIKEFGPFTKVLIVTLIIVGILATFESGRELLKNLGLFCGFWGGFATLILLVCAFWNWLWSCKHKFDEHCRCTKCGETIHKWDATATCGRCQLKCDHPGIGFISKDQAADDLWHRSIRCDVCGTWFNNQDAKHLYAYREYESEFN